MSTPNQFARRALMRFEDAVRTHEMKGTCHPDEHSHIEQRYQKAKRHLITFLPKSEIGEVVETRGATNAPIQWSWEQDEMGKRITITSSTGKSYVIATRELSAIALKVITEMLKDLT